jgi:glycosyltransferase involved in cell wall biosynthesis
VKKDVSLGTDQAGSYSTENPPTLSVIVLTYNSASTIERCLDSLVAQDLSDFDTTIVDDDSTDETVSIVLRYASRLRLTVVKNGSHNIPRGRNIGLNQTTADVVAFVDSDDFADSNWTRIIVNTFIERPELALIAGGSIPAYGTRSSEAIAMIDTTVRDFVGKGVMRFAAGNCAINQRVLPGGVFREDFRAAEDLELVSRVQRVHPCSYVPTMLIHYSSRDSFRQYAKQMYHYGFMKMYFGYSHGTFRVIDFAPLALVIASVIAAVILGEWWILSAIFAFSLLESLFVIVYKRCRPLLGLATFPAWLTKNIAWSVGVAQAVGSLAINSSVRRQLRAEHMSDTTSGVVSSASSL